VASSYIRIAGLPYPVEIGTPGKIATLLGSIQLSRDGAPQDGRRDEREEWSAGLSCDTQEGAEEAARILNGEVHSFGFNGALESFGGVTPSAGSAINARLDPVGGKHGGAARLDAGGAVIYAVQAGSEWTILAVTRNDVADEPWRSFAVRSDGREWEDGAENVVPVGVSNFAFVFAGFLGFFGGDLASNPLARFFDSVLFVPWIVSPETLDAWTTLDEPFSPFPDLYMRGDAVAEPLGYVVTAEARSGEYFATGGLAPGWTNNGVKQAFTVRESTQRDEGLRFSSPVVSLTFDAADTAIGAPEVRDVSGGGFHATLVGGATSGIAEGRPVDGIAAGEAMIVPAGAVTGCQIPDDPALDIVGDLTIALWVRPDSLAPAFQILAEKIAGNVNAYQLAVASTGSLVFLHSTGLLTGDLVTSSAGLVTAGRWSHVIAVRRAGLDVVFYIDGARDVRGRQATSFGGGANAAALTLGAQVVGASDFVGAQDEFGLWSVAASATDALGIYLETARGARYRGR